MPYDAKGRKTWKREVAAALLVFLCVIVWRAAQDDPIGALGLIVWPIMLFAGAAWGMDWAGKSDVIASALGGKSSPQHHWHNRAPMQDREAGSDAGKRHSTTSDEGELLFRRD